MVSILIADDHPFTLMGTKSFVESLGYAVSDVCSNGITALNLIKIHEPEIAILDINMPGLDGLEVLQQIQLSRLPTSVILLTMHKEKSVFDKANQHGVFGYILKEFAQNELKICIQQVLSKKQYISPHLLSELVWNQSHAKEGIASLSFVERKVLALVAEGKTSKQIAELLFISEKTVEGHRSKIIQKLNLPKEKNALLVWASVNYNDFKKY